MSQFQTKSVRTSLLLSRTSDTVSLMRSRSGPSSAELNATGHSFRAGDNVVILSHDDGAAGQTGVVIRVYPSGRCLIGTGRLNQINVHPDNLKHEVLNGHSTGHSSKEDADERADSWPAADPSDEVPELGRNLRRG